MNITTKKINTTGNACDVYADGAHIGQVFGSGSAWYSAPSVNGSFRPASFTRNHEWRKAAIARLVRHMHDADL